MSHKGVRGMRGFHYHPVFLDCSYFYFVEMFVSKMFQDIVGQSTTFLWEFSAPGMRDDIIFPKNGGYEILAK